jgi:hypothetical protein
MGCVNSDFKRKIKSQEKQLKKIEIQHKLISQKIEEFSKLKNKYKNPEFVIENNVYFFFFTS